MHGDLRRTSERIVGCRDERDAISQRSPAQQMQHMDDDRAGGRTGKALAGQEAGEHHAIQAKDERIQARRAIDQDPRSRTKYANSQGRASDAYGHVESWIGDGQIAAGLTYLYL